MEINLEKLQSRDRISLIRQQDWIREHPHIYELSCSKYKWLKHEYPSLNDRWNLSETIDGLMGKGNDDNNT